MAKKAHYVVNEAKKKVTYTVGTLTEKERSEVIEYKEVGYDIVIKQKEKKNGLTFDDMKKAAKGKAFEKELFRRRYKDIEQRGYRRFELRYRADV
jgi:hypothetical protein